MFELVSSFYSGRWGIYTWKRADECQIHKKWNISSGKWLKKRLYYAQVNDKQPAYINDGIWKELKDEWNKHDKYDAAVAECEEGSREVDKNIKWIETVGIEKGRIYGLGNLAPSITLSRLRSEV
ncbi:hypothetical protein M9H77_20558 [Catharanthus roseus]|uniref:Uncharacterized protein n=1 Tax=Catharanthus roseus TaxID=4058 RepID=A0ACC0ALT9_CATRO|nr:hypothetical protein M9H77_20558 [Catharanthus roseus]